MRLDFDRVHITGLSRHFGRRRALSQITFGCGTGEVLGLIGPNGAGKSTLLAVLSTLLRPSAGEVRYGSHSGADAHLRRRLGWLGHDLQLYPELTARENLRFFAALQGIDASVGSISNAARKIGQQQAISGPEGGDGQGQKQGMDGTLSVATDVVPPDKT